MEKQIFFDEIRVLFRRPGEKFGKLTQSQVDGIEMRIEAFKAANWSVSWAAYALATIFHETAQTMRPVREAPNASEDWRRRNFRYYPYYGRGDVQLTWEKNYRWADELLGLNGALVKDPDVALVEAYSIRIMIVGMELGKYTGKSLDDYLPMGPAVYEQFVKARRIINGRDCDVKIAGYAMKFQAALLKAGY